MDIHISICITADTSLVLLLLLLGSRLCLNVRHLNGKLLKGSSSKLNGSIWRIRFYFISEWNPPSLTVYYSNDADGLIFTSFYISVRNSIFQCTSPTITDGDSNRNNNINNAISLIWLKVRRICVYQFRRSIVKKKRKRIKRFRDLIGRISKIKREIRNFSIKNPPSQQLWRWADSNFKSEVQSSSPSSPNEPSHSDSICSPRPNPTKIPQGTTTSRFDFDEDERKCMRQKNCAWVAPPPPPDPAKDIQHQPLSLC